MTSPSLSLEEEEEVNLPSSSFSSSAIAFIETSLREEECRKHPRSSRPADIVVEEVKRRFAAQTTRTKLLLLLLLLLFLAVVAFVDFVAKTFALALILLLLLEAPPPPFDDDDEDRNIVIDRSVDVKSAIFSPNTTFFLLKKFPLYSLFNQKKEEDHHHQTTNPFGEKKKKERNDRRGGTVLPRVGSARAKTVSALSLSQKKKKSEGKRGK
jgi:hypothetical protein